jgi:TonB family protein
MIRVTLVLALGLAAASVLRRRPAALRHWVLAATLVCAALLPLIEAVAPVWQLPLLPARAAGLAPALTLGDAPGGQATSTTARAPAAAFRTLAIVPMVRSIWAVGIGLAFLVLATGIGRLVWMAARARPVQDGRWAAEAAALAGRSALIGPPAILQTSHPTLLFTWGLRRPKVLLPRDAATWSDDTIRIVLGHELAHVRRGDWAVQLLADCVRCVYWFNPLVWIACRRLRLESEHACDDAVLRLGVAAPDYANQLLELARLFRQSRRSLFPAPAMARPSDLERRVRVMLNARTDRSPIGRASSLLVLLALLALTVPIAGLSLTASAPPAGNAAPTTAAAPRSAVPTPVAAVYPAAKPRQSVKDGSQAAAPGTFVLSVTDQLGRPVPNARILLSRTMGPFGEGLTNKGGQVTFSDLPSGEYQITVRMPGFMAVRLNVSLEAGKTTNSAVTLQLGALAETVVVSGVAGTKPAGPFAPTVRHAGVPAAEDPCSQSLEGGCVTPPRKLVEAKPIYPGIQLENGVSGEVVIEGRVRTDGSVGDLQPAPGADPDFADAAMHAIRLWQFSPTRLDGVPMEVRLTVTVRFQATAK